MTPQQEWACNYVSRAGRQPLEDWAEDPEKAARYWPGCSLDDLRFAAEVVDLATVETDIEGGRRIVAELGFNPIWETAPRKDRQR